MSEWLALLEDVGEISNPSPDTRTKPDKTSQSEAVEGFCTVLSGCRVEETEKGRVDFWTDPAAQIPKKAAIDRDTFRHGTAFDGTPKTWTGKVVSLDAWRQLSEWEKHGPNGKHWNGKTHLWEMPE